MNAEIRPSHFWHQKDPEKSFSERALRLLSRIECRRADSVKEREAIFRLRRQAYHHRDGACLPDSFGAVSDHYDEAKNTYLFAFYVDGELASSLRLHIGSPECPIVPSLKVFRGQLQGEFAARKILIETSRLVTSEKLSRRHRELPYVTLRFCTLAAEYFSAHYWLAVVGAEHRPFYQRAFNHRLVSESRPSPRPDTPCSLMMLDFPSAANELYRKYPFFRSSTFERRRVFERQQHSVYTIPGLHS